MRALCRAAAAGLLVYAAVYVQVATVDATRIHLQRPFKPSEAVLDLFYRSRGPVRVAALAGVCLWLSRRPPSARGRTRHCPPRPVAAEPGVAPDPRRQ